MAQKSRVVWVRPPSKLVENLDGYQRMVNAAVVALAEFIGQKMQGDARKNAPWQDRTGNARSGLIYQVVNEASKEIVTIYLIHSVFYGKFLEFRLAGRYAIIWPTINRHLPEIKKLLDGIFK